MKLALVIGHRSGAKGAYGNMGISEHDFYTKFVPELVKRLEHEKFEHEYKVFYRFNDGGNGYTERMKDLHKRIDSWGAKVSISFHFNAAGNESINGHEILYCSNNGHDLAIGLDELFDAYLDNRDRNIKKRTKKQRGGGFLCRGKSTCVLIEPFFAAHQNRFIEGSDMREPLKNALVDFISTLQ